MGERRRPVRAKEPASWELVLKRNPVERLKQERSPLGIRDELPALIALGYESVPEEDIVRLQWWGLYHDKPKVGTFMLRIKLSSGIVAPAKLRAIGEVANRYGGGDAELTTRQCIQLHRLRLEELPNVFAELDAAGITTAGGCGDTVRNITGCPVAGIDAHELFDSTALVERASRHFYGNPDFANLPRKHKYSIASCAERCNAPEINDVALIGVVHEGREGYAVKIGGGLSSVPRLGRDLGVFVPADEAIEFLEAATGVWSDDLRYRVSRVKARMKFMVDDVGAEGMRERIEARLGRALGDYELEPLDAPPGDHLGVQPQKRAGLSYVGVPVRLGLVNGGQLIAVAALAEALGGDVRVTRQQNLVVTGAPDERLDEALARLAEIGFTLELNGVWGSSIGCTGEPYCNFSVGETKERLGRLLAHLEATFGDEVAALRLNLDGCPHSCAQHWLGDLGFQGTTGKDADGRRLSAYDIFVRGGLAPEPAIGRPLFRRVPSERIEAAVEGLVRGWLDGRSEGESFTEFQRRLCDEELGALAGLEPARSRREAGELAA